MESLEPPLGSCELLPGFVSLKRALYDSRVLVNFLHRQVGELPDEGDDVVVELRLQIALANLLVDLFRVVRFVLDDCFLGVVLELDEHVDLPELLGKPGCAQSLHALLRLGHDESALGKDSVEGPHAGPEYGLWLYIGTAEFSARTGRGFWGEGLDGKQGMGLFSFLGKVRKRGLDGLRELREVREVRGFVDGTDFVFMHSWILFCEQRRF
mmetsp:Transcript_35620/g.41234  ORF Transcript_35620/g.41234 Transcript_35620/m.41234 type:complete len:211 (-) Transcript_35620:842-1474(-)